MPPRRNLATIATETKNKLKEWQADPKQFEKQLPFAIPHSIKYSAANPVPYLNPDDCPRYRVLPCGDDEEDGYEYGTRIRVINEDAFDAAIELSQDLGGNDPPVAVLNLGNPNVPGGGWEEGSNAQEEHLYYRSTLSLSLHAKDYPIKDACGIYSPSVAIIRDSEKNGHGLYENLNEGTYVAILTIAATSRPKICTKEQKAPGDYTPDGKYFADPAEAELLREKIRIVLRMAAYHGHSRIVLGAVGCGVFANPRERVAELFLHVFMEEEFTGGWFEDVVFAIKDPHARGGYGTGSHDVFFRQLNGVVV